MVFWFVLLVFSVKPWVFNGFLVFFNGFYCFLLWFLLVFLFFLSVFSVKPWVFNSFLVCFNGFYCFLPWFLLVICKKVGLENFENFEVLKKLEEFLINFVGWLNFGLIYGLFGPHSLLLNGWVRDGVRVWTHYFLFIGLVNLILLRKIVLNWKDIGFFYAGGLQK